LATDHEIEARVENDREARDHRHPTDLGQSDTSNPIAAWNAEFKDEADCVKGNAPGTNQDRPEVKARIATECIEDRDGEPRTSRVSSWFFGIDLGVEISLMSKQTIYLLLRHRYA